MAELGRWHGGVSPLCEAVEWPGWQVSYVQDPQPSRDVVLDEVDVAIQVPVFPRLETAAEHILVLAPETTLTFGAPVPLPFCPGANTI